MFNKSYTIFLEEINLAKDINSLYKSLFKVLLNIFNDFRLQIWKSLENDYSITADLNKENQPSTIKFMIKRFPESSKTIIKKDSIWETQTKDELLNKLDIYYIVGMDFYLEDSIKALIIIALKEKNKELNKNEIELLDKIRIHFEKAFKKYYDFQNSSNEAKRLFIQNENLREQDRLRTNFINSISHEFRTPLSSILGFSKMLVSKNNLNDSIKDIVHQIQQATGRLSSLITDFLQINRITTEGWLAYFEPCDIGEVIKSSIEEFTSLHKTHKISYTVLGNYPIFKTDPKLVRQVIDNLILNAIKYSPSGRTINITIDVSSDKKEIHVTVTDEGIGISKEELPKIFNRLYRSSNPDVQKVLGSGLGLTICKEIIISLGGKIEARSELGKGSNFTFILPLS